MLFKVGNIEVDLLNGDRICEGLAKKGPFEPESLSAWAGMIEPGRVALDVGSYSGLYAIAAAKLGAYSIAFEPMPQLAERIMGNVKRNKVENFESHFGLYRLAASDKDGFAEIVHNPKIAYSSGASLVRKKGERLKVKTARIDSLGLDDVCAIKIDVEKHEPAVLRGAKALILRCRPKMIVEALDEDLRAACLAELPEYKISAVLDVRNLLLEPR